MSIVSIARPEIQALRAYDAAEQVDDSIRLNANESPQLNAEGNFRRPLNRYPEVRPQQLQRAMAERFGCRADQLLVTRGSSEAIDLLIRSFCRAGQDSVLTPSPSFSMYRHYAELQDAAAIEVPMSAELDFAIDVDRLLAACDDSTKLIFVCSPNNPTGTALLRKDLLRLLKQRSDQSAVVVDEAYVEFGDNTSAIELLDEYPNLVVLRTLSKALGFAGARCGAVTAARDVIAMLSAVQAPYALATPVVECVENAFAAKQLAIAAESVEQVIAERQRLMTAIAEFEFVEKVWPSQANFFLVRVKDAETLMSHCNANKVLLRHFGGELSDCIRISVGSLQDNASLLSILSQYAETQVCP
jgi:histidinol-phosphate aminotransferase